VSLRSETDGAAALLSAAGIEVRVDLDLPPVAPEVEDVLAWAVREGVTNVLRHSEAGTCSITAGHRDGTIWLEIANDGAPVPAGEGGGPSGGGSGLAGVAERVRALSGSVAVERPAPDRFRLRVRLPDPGEAA
jgi:two-component system sensor histidine kinase DesK